MSARSALVPQLAVRRGREASEFYKAAFGAVEVYRVGGSDEHEPVVAQLQIGEASFWVHDESPENGTFSPEALGGASVRLLLVVEDPDAAMAQALAAGASVVRPLGDEHRWRLGCVADPYGHRWEIGHPLVAWPPGARGEPGLVSP